MALALTLALSIHADGWVSGKVVFRLEPPEGVLHADQSLDSWCFACFGMIV
ncbi:hypothetical protein KC19_10G012100 [Ceratodon purpureus]|uniref:Uncharacterized protein n=1 Tax=Ceratodon purpureus TaxID=3225 RepID=A0A8T0GFJ6_CERPU|nr:hypothetical protein KC19_10G012100 [Ceratodon purpureus]